MERDNQRGLPVQDKTPKHEDDAAGQLAASDDAQRQQVIAVSTRIAEISEELNQRLASGSDPH